MHGDLHVGRAIHACMQVGRISISACAHLWKDYARRTHHFRLGRGEKGRI